MDSYRFGWVQAVRAIAALMVVVDHSLLTLMDKASLDPGLVPVANGLGYAGVSAFFCVSGFVMVHTTRASFGSPQSGWEFLAKRIWRIVPLYWIATAIYAAKLLLEGDPASQADLIGSLLFIPYLEPDGQLGAVYGLGWTLNFEMYFYVAFAFAMLLPRTVGLVLLTAGLALMPTLHLASILPASTNAFVAQASSHMIFYFLVGGMLYEIMRVLGYLKIFEGPPAGRAGLFLLLAGDASYSIYLTHSFVLGPSARVWNMLSVPQLAWPIFVIAMLASTVAVGIFVHLWIEKPLLGLLKPLLPKRPMVGSTQTFEEKKVAGE